MKDFSEGIALFNGGEFFLAHDFFEDLWFESGTDDKIFFQALVQISVGSYHFICGNFSGAESQLGKSLAKFQKIADRNYSVNLYKLIADINKFLEYVCNIREKNVDLDYNVIPKIELKS